MIQLTWADVAGRAHTLAAKIEKECGLCSSVYPIPNGGIFAGMIVVQSMKGSRLVECPSGARVLVDDIVDSGATRKRFHEQHKGLPFYALVDKQAEGITDWVSFPWERYGKNDGPQDNIRRLLEFIGEDPTR